MEPRTDRPAAGPQGAEAVQNVFEEALERASARLPGEDAAPFYDLDGPVLARRMAAVRAAEERARPWFPDSDSREWLLFRLASIASSPEVSLNELDGRYGITAAAALHLLDSLPPENLEKAKDLLSQVGHGDPDLLPIRRDLRFGTDLIRRTAVLIRQRDDATLQDRPWFNTATAARVGSSEASDPVTESRALFLAVWDLVPSARKERAARLFEEAVWRYLELICTCHLIYRKAAGEHCRSLNAVLTELNANPFSCKGVQERKFLKRSIEELQRVASVSDPEWRTAPPPAPITTGLVARLRYTLRGHREEIIRGQTEISSLVRREWKLLRSGLLSNRNWDPNEETALDRQVLEKLDSFSVEDPFELCFGFLCLLEQGSQIPWLYNPAAVVLQAAGRLLPWTESADPADAPASGTVLPPRGDRTESDFVRAVYRLTETVIPDRTPAMTQRQTLLEETGASPGIALDLARLIQLSRLMAKPALPPLPEEPEERAPKETPEQIREREARRTLADLRRKTKDLEARNRDLEAAIREASARSEAEQENGRLAVRQVGEERRELQDLRAMLIRTLQGQEEPDEEAPEAGVSRFPCRTRKRVVVFGGHETWQGLLQNLLPEITIVPAEQQPDRDMIRNADTVWIQIRSFTHKYYFPVINTVRGCSIPVRYFSHGSARLCAEQILEDEKVSV